MVRVQSKMPYCKSLVSCNRYDLIRSTKESYQLLIYANNYITHVLSHYFDNPKTKVVDRHKHSTSRVE